MVQSPEEWGKKIEFWHRRWQTTGVLLKCQKELHRRVWNGLTHPSGAGAHQACAQLGTGSGSLGLVGSCFPPAELQTYPAELEMQLSNYICTWYSLHKIFKCNLHWVFLASHFPNLSPWKQICINAVPSTGKSEKKTLCRPWFFFFPITCKI